MTSELRELYQSVILDHHKKPRNFRKLGDANRQAEGYNPLCGDKVKVYVRLEGDVVKDIGFEGAGCAISTAAASMMTEALKGKTRSEVEAMFQRFHGLLTQERAQKTEDGKEQQPALGKLEVFSGVREFPIRIKCATLPWHTLREALAGGDHTVTTE